MSVPPRLRMRAPSLFVVQLEQGSEPTIIETSRKRLSDPRKLCDHLVYWYGVERWLDATGLAHTAGRATSMRADVIASA